MSTVGKITAWAKDHPAALGIGVFVLGLIVLYLLWPRAPAAAAQTRDTSLDSYYTAAGQAAAAGNQLQAANLAAQADSNKTAAELQSALDQHATDLQIATLVNNTSLQQTGITAETDRARIAATATSADLASTLTAQVQGAGVEAQRQIGLYSIAGATEQAQIAAQATISGQYYDAQKANSAYNAQIAGYDYANRTAEAGYASQTAGYMYGSASAIAASQYAARSAEAGYYYGSQSSIAQSQAARDAAIASSMYDYQKIAVAGATTLGTATIAAQREIAYNQWAQVYRGGAPIDYSGPLGTARTGIAPTISTAEVYAHINEDSDAGRYARQVLGLR